jgi:tetratricopeptide (TPR) repeat protein
MAEDREREGVARRLGLTRSDADAYYRRGLQSFEDGDLENAILDLSESIHYDGGHAEYYSTRGLFYVQDNQTPEAETDLNYALKLDKRQWLAHYALGILDFTAGDYEAAVKHFSDAGAIRPNRPEIWYYRAMTEHNLGDDVQAQGDMEKAEQLFPTSDKRRKDATAWVRELKKNAVTAPKPGASGPSGAPPLKSGAPQLGQPGQAGQQPRQFANPSSSTNPQLNAPDEDEADEPDKDPGDQ